MAGRIALDLKKFKHVKSDKDSTTLQHKDGHQLVLAHHKLGPEFKAQLAALNPVDKEAMTPDQAREAKSQKMADGGQAQDPTKDSSGEVKQGYKDVAQNARQDKPSEEAQTASSASKMWSNVKNAWAEGGEICKEPKMLAEGDPDIGGVKQIVPNRIPGPDVDYNPQPKFQGDIGFSPEEFGQIVGHAVAAAKSGIGKVKETAGEVGRGFNSGVMQAGGPDLSGADEAQPQPPQQPQAQAQPQDQAQQAPLPNPQSPVPEPGPAPQAGTGEFQPKATIPGAESALTTGIKEERAGLQQKGQAEGELATAQADVAKAGAEAQQGINDRYREEYGQLNDERMNHIHDLQNNMVDPNKYWDSHSKIATGIGMIIAGFNPTSNPNAAVNFLKTQMEQNLEAQKANQGTRQNILSATMEQFKDAHAATEMARVIQNDTVAHQLLAAAPQAKSAIAQANAKAAAGKLLQDSSQKLQQLAQYKTMMGMINHQQGAGSSEDTWQQRNRMLNMFNPEMAKYESERHVPGIGEASTPVPDGAKNQMRAHKDVNNTMNEVLEFAQKNAGSLDPKIRAQGNALINQLQSQIRVAEDQGVYKESEANFMKKTIGDSPAGFLANYTTVPKVRELQELKQKSYNNLLGQYGLKPQQLPHEAKAPQYKTVNGIKYMRGPNGEAIPVK